MTEPRNGNGLLKMRELAAASGVSPGTIKHYLREGLLPEPVRTSRNMAYYPPEFVDRIRLIKQLQEERFMPLKLIKGVLDKDPERARRLVELEDRVLERALAGRGQAHVGGRGAAPLRHAEGGARPAGRARRACRRRRAATAPRDVRIVEAISRFRAGGYDERIGFTVYDTLLYKRALDELVKEEVHVLLDRLAGEMDAEEAADLIANGAEPLHDLIGALHAKALVAELERQRAARALSGGTRLRHRPGRAAGSRSRTRRRTRGDRSPGPAARGRRTCCDESSKPAGFDVDSHDAGPSSDTR